MPNRLSDRLRARFRKTRQQLRRLRRAAHSTASLSHSQTMPDVSLAAAKIPSDSSASTSYSGKALCEEYACCSRLFR
jgi:hypothetical protein